MHIVDILCGLADRYISRLGRCGGCSLYSALIVQPGPHLPCHVNIYTLIPLIL